MTTEEKFQKLSALSDGPFDAFLYDCDGTLADNMRAHKAAYLEVADRYGLSIDPDIIDELAGWPTVKVAEELRRRYGKQFDPEEFSLQKSAFFIEKYVWHTRRVEFVARHLLDNAGKKRIAVVTGSKRTTVTKTLEAIQLLDHIELLVCANETPQGKPYPDPFLKAANLLNVEPSRCLVFEDGLPGETAAHSAGMQCIRVDKIERHMLPAWDD